MPNKEVLNLEFKTKFNKILYIDVHNSSETEKIIAERISLGEIFCGIKDIDSILNDIDNDIKYTPPFSIFIY